MSIKDAHQLTRCFCCILPWYSFLSRLSSCCSLRLASSMSIPPESASSLLFSNCSSAVLCSCRYLSSTGFKQSHQLERHFISSHQNVQHFRVYSERFGQRNVYFLRHMCQDWQGLRLWVYTVHQCFNALQQGRGLINRWNLYMVIQGKIRLILHYLHQYVHKGVFCQSTKTLCKCDKKIVQSCNK